MSATVIDGKAAGTVRGRLPSMFRDLRIITASPGLAVILVGKDPATRSMLRPRTSRRSRLAWRALTSSGIRHL